MLQIHKAIHFACFEYAELLILNKIILSFIICMLPILHSTCLGYVGLYVLDKLYHELVTEGTVIWFNLYFSCYKYKEGGALA